MTIPFTVIGIFSVSLLTKLPSIGVFYLLISVIIVLTTYVLLGGLLFNRKRHREAKPTFFSYYRYSRYAAVLLISFLLGVSYSYLRASLLLDKQLATDLDNRTFVIEGVIDSLLKRSQSSLSFNFSVKALSLENADKSLSAINTSTYKKVRLAYYLDKNAKNNNLTKVNTGDYWHFKVKLKRPRGFVNPSGFDYQAYLLAQGLSATGYIKNSQANKKVSNHCRRLSSIKLSVNCLRANLRDFLDKHFSQSMVLGVLKGLLIGDKQSVTKKQWKTLKNTGTIHLLAISGLHVGLAASIGFLLGRFAQSVSQLLLFQLSRCQLFLPKLLIGMYIFRVVRRIALGRYIPPLCSILLALVYSLLAGFSLPTQRALIMLVAFHCSLLLYRKPRPWLLWSVALLLSALLDPLAVYQQGFYLSFGAVAVLILVFNGYIPYKSGDTSSKYLLLNQCSDFLLGFSKGQWAISIGLLLPSILLLKGASVFGFVANSIAIPVVSLITVPLILVGFLLLPIASSLALFVFSLAEQSVLFLFTALESIEQLGIRFLPLSLSHTSFLSLLLAIVGICYILLPRGIPSRWLGWVCVLPLFLPLLLPGLFIQKHLPALEITVFDVGQGTAITLETPNHTLVYDTGRRYSDSFDVGEHILSPYLLKKQKNTIDMLMISHNDADHVGGANGLLKFIEVGNIYAGESADSELRNVTQCSAGQQWQWDGVDFTVIWPTAAAINRTHNKASLKSNNLSCVLLISYQSQSILLSGDIEASVEKQLIDYRWVPRGISLLLAPHHGSRSSSHINWVNYVQAKYVVFSAGYKNVYHHPHERVVEAYHAAGARSFNTAKDGAIKFIINDNKAVIGSSRKTQKRYWYD